MPYLHGGSTSRNNSDRDSTNFSLEKMHDELEYFFQLGYVAAIMTRILHPHVLRFIIY